MRVIGALYGVRLAVSNGESDANVPAKTQTRKPAKRRTTRRRPPAVKNARTRTAVETDAGTAKDETTLRPVGSPSNAEIRSWARQNGLTVSDRGRVPASAVAAYRSAHNE